MGARLRPLVDNLTGVDISAEMLNLARRKNLYDRLELAGLLRVAHGEVVDAVAIDVSKLVVGVETELPGQPMHGARWDSGSGRDLSHGQGRDIAGVVQDVGDAFLELPAQMVLFLAGTEQRTVPRQMWAGIREQISPTILAVATLLILLSVVLLLMLEYLRRRNERLRGIQA